MDITGNYFIRRQLDATLEAERKIVCLYAEFCFLNIQIVLDNVSSMERLEQLADELAQAERRFQLSRAALHRLGVPGSEIAGVPASEISAMVSPALIRATNRSTILCSLCI